jgi:hypothetical protein
VAGFVFVLAGVVLAAGGGVDGLARWLPGAASSATPGPTAISSAGPIAPPSASPGSSRAPATPEPSSTPAPSLTPEPTPSATPAAAKPFSMNLYRKGVFVHQATKETCVAAAAQNMLNVIRFVEEGRKPDRTSRSQLALYNRIARLTTWEDAHNGGTGPGGWAALLTEKGYPYEVRVFASRNEAIRAAARAIRATNRPVGVLAWAGVHSWVMTGFPASRDPAAGGSFVVTTARIIDPWYPWVSSRWPKSEAPNVPRDAADLKANVRPWKLASGPYEGRDGKFLLVVPVGG